MTAAIVSTFKEKLIRDDVTRNSIIMVGSGVISAVFGYLWRIAMGVMVHSDYHGIIRNLFPVLLIISIFSLMINNSTAQITSKFEIQNITGALAYLRSKGA